MLAENLLRSIQEEVPWYFAYPWLILCLGINLILFATYLLSIIHPAFKEFKRHFIVYLTMNAVNLCFCAQGHMAWIYYLNLSDERLEAIGFFGLTIPAVKFTLMTLILLTVLWKWTSPKKHPYHPYFVALLAISYFIWSSFFIFPGHYATSVFSMRAFTSTIFLIRFYYMLIVDSERGRLFLLDILKPTLKKYGIPEPIFNILWIISLFVPCQVIFELVLLFFYNTEPVIRVIVFIIHFPAQITLYHFPNSLYPDTLYPQFWSYHRDTKELLKVGGLPKPTFLIFKKYNSLYCA